MSNGTSEKRRTVLSRGLTHAVCTLAVLGLALPAAPAFADPPPWAPAHGYRAKHAGKHYGSARLDLPRYLSLPSSGFGNCNRDLLGTVIGGVAGGAAGTQIGSGSGRTAAIIAGTILGGILGGSVGRSMDRLDTQCVGQVLEHVPTGRPVEWQNPDADAGYRVTPTRTYQTTEGRYCREYTATATVGGKQQQTYGTACRQPDGSWQIVS